MTRKILTLTMFVCLSVAAIAQTSSLTTETKNNTSACSTSTFPSYCFEALPNLTTFTVTKSSTASSCLFLR